MRDLRKTCNGIWIFSGSRHFKGFHKISSYWLGKESKGKFKKVKRKHNICHYKNDLSHFGIFKMIPLKYFWILH